MSTLILVRALPGAGKTTVAELLEHGLCVQYANTMIVSADDFFHVGDEEPHCSYEVMKDPGLLRGADLYRWRVGRSVRRDVPYRFEAPLIGHAHTWCMEQVRNMLASTANVGIVVHNTFTRRWEMEPYFKLARDFRSDRVHVVSLYDGGCSDEELAYRNTHGVPLEVIQTFRRHWELDWKNGSPTRAVETPTDSPTTKKTDTQPTDSDASRVHARASTETEND